MSDAGAADPVPSASVRVMRLRYRGVCEVCGAQLPAGATAVYDRERRKVRCVECPATGNDVETAVDEVPYRPRRGQLNEGTAHGGG